MKPRIRQELNAYKARVLGAARNRWKQGALNLEMARLILCQMCFGGGCQGCRNQGVVEEGSPNGARPSTGCSGASREGSRYQRGHSPASKTQNTTQPTLPTEPE